MYLPNSKSTSKIYIAFKASIINLQDYNSNKSELVSAVANSTDLKQTEAAKAVDATLEAIIQAVAKSEDVHLVGFGSFGINQRAAREGRNPRTGETIKIPTSKAPNFKVGKEFKDAVN